ncbi:hypothetical protein [Chroococcidiopsis sp. TS-821]|nr:hypothetical protein [Chroococcidiopsis sp. TS-821]
MYFALQAIALYVNVASNSTAYLPTYRAVYKSVLALDATNAQCFDRNIN